MNKILVGKFWPQSKYTLNAKLENHNKWIHRDSTIYSVTVEYTAVELWMIHPQFLIS
jgi:hypothetical protein